MGEDVRWESPLGAEDTPLEPLLVLDEVCQELRISVHTGRKLVQSGRLQCYRNGGIVRFTREHIREFLEGRGV